LRTASASITHGVALSQALQLGDDLAVELRVLEAEHDELNWPDGHGSASSIAEAPTVTQPDLAHIARMG
jgi:hypothetical protein